MVLFEPVLRCKGTRAARRGRAGDGWAAHLGWLARFFSARGGVVRPSRAYTDAFGGPAGLSWSQRSALHLPSSGCGVNGRREGSRREGFSRCWRGFFRARAGAVRPSRGYREAPEMRSGGPGVLVSPTAAKEPMQRACGGGAASRARRFEAGPACTTAAEGWERAPAKRFGTTTTTTIELDTPCAEPGAEQPRTRPCVRAPPSRSVASCERRSAAQVQDRLRWLIGPTARRLADSFSAAGPSRGVLEMSTVHETRRPGCCSPRCWPASIGKCHGHDVDKMVSPRYPRVEPT